jgi:ribosomal protein S2
LTNRKKVISANRRKAIFTNRKKAISTNRKKAISTRAIPHIIFITNVFQNAYIINESLALNIPVVGLADTNENPLNHTFPIPGNSKSLNSVYFFYMLIYRLVKLTNLDNKEFFVKSISTSNKLNLHNLPLSY